MLAEFFFVPFIFFFLSQLFTVFFIYVLVNPIQLQESAAYRGTIRRHVDLESVRRRLDASVAASRADDDHRFPARELYRDLLLLCTNAVVFFPRGTPEHAAAVEARALVTGHASAVLHEPKQEHARGCGGAGIGRLSKRSGSDVAR